MTTIAKRAGIWGAFIKVEHTLFSLPVLLAGAYLGAGGTPPGARLLWIAIAGIGARTLAMALNRIIDRRIDALNPRTADRELPAGRMSVSEAWGIAALGAAVYGIACVQLPPVCLLLSPLPVVVFVGYPFLKRVTPLAHFGVGLALALAPLGAFVATTGRLTELQPALWLALFTGLWVAGFDIIYATLDEHVDRSQKIRSLPATLGRARALVLAALVHAGAMAALVVLYSSYLAGWLAALALAAVAGALVAEHRFAHRVNLAFFHINILVGFLVFACVLAGLLARG